MISFDIIVAMDEDNGIGKAGKLPWHLSGDLKHFKEITTARKNPAKQNAVVMGRKTWESLPDKFRPLPERINVVLTRAVGLHLPSGVFQSSSFGHALETLNRPDLQSKVESIFVIGGGQIFKEAMAHPQCRCVYLTKIFSKFDCDTFFPSIPNDFQIMHKTTVSSEGDIPYCFLTLFHSTHISDAMK